MTSYLDFFTFNKLPLILLVFASHLVNAQQNKEFNAGHIKSEMLKVANWQFKHPNGKHENTWTNAAFYTGILEAYKTTGSSELLDSLMEMGERNNWQPAKRYDHADDIAISQIYIDLYRIKKERRMIQPTIDTVARLMNVPGNEITNHGITWWWCDALFMAPPALAKLSKTLNNPAYLALCDKLYLESYELLFNKEEHLFARDASFLTDAEGNEKKEANGKKIFWGRGNGWVVAGLVRVLEEMPEKYHNRKYYISLFKEMAGRLKDLQQPDGLWRTSLLDPGTYPGGEASGTGFICYALAWGVNQGILDKKAFTPVIRNAWKGLSKLVTKEGKVGWVQPIGKDPRQNFNEETSEAYGAGAYLLAASQIINRFQDEPDTILKKKLIYQNTLGKEREVKDWIMEGPGTLKFRDGWMEMFSPGKEWDHVFWCPRDYPSSFIAEWEVQNLDTSEGLTIVFFAATGNKGQDIFDPALPKRDGTFKYYNKGQINCYHISYYANNPKNPDRQNSHLRKDPMFALLQTGKEGIAAGSLAVHKICLVKNKSRIMMFVDDNKIIDYTDEDLAYGPAYFSGKIGFRQMRWSHFRYRDFKIWEIK